MEGIDRIEHAYRVDPAGKQGQRKRRDSDEEFKEYLEHERDEAGEHESREEAPRAEKHSETPADLLAGIGDIVDIRLRFVHKPAANATHKGDPLDIDIKATEADNDISAGEEQVPDGKAVPVRRPASRIDEIV